MKIKTILVALFAACAAMAEVNDDAWNWYENEALPLGGKAFTDTATFFERWPAAAKDKLPSGLVYMGRHTTGMYLRFTTDSDKIRIEWKVRDEHPYDPLIPESGAHRPRRVRLGRVRRRRQGRVAVPGEQALLAARQEEPRDRAVRLDAGTAVHRVPAPARHDALLPHRRREGEDDHAASSSTAGARRVPASRSPRSPRATSTCRT